MTTSSKLPPFALQQKAKRPQNGLWVFAGVNAWERARADQDKPSRLATLLPLHQDPTAYRWPVSGDEVVIIHTGGESPEALRALAAVLVQQGALLVCLLDAEARPLYFRPGLVEEAA